jgi:hypothetical protein
MSMKKRHITFMVFFGLLLGIGGWIYFHNPLVADNSALLKPHAHTAVKPQESSLPKSAAVNSLKLPQGWRVISVDAAISTEAGQKRIKQFQDVWNSHNSKSQDFYGLVIDQYGQPVSDVDVTGTIMLIQGMDVATKKEVHKIKTDSRGMFEFTGLHGWELGVYISKLGYEMDGRGRAYKAPAKATQPSPEDRAVFTMWKLKGAEQMVSVHKLYKMSCDGAGYTIDLVSSAMTKDTSGLGDLQISASRPAQAKRGDKFDWTISLEAVGGGLIETGDAYLNEAPESGYQKQYAITMLASDPHSQELIQEKRLYLKSREGRVYGWLKIEFYPHYNEGSALGIEALLNPAGSRNLEYDPIKVVTAGSPAAKLLPMARVVK